MKLQLCTVSISEVIWPVTGFGESGIVSVGGGPFGCVCLANGGAETARIEGRVWVALAAAGNSTPPLCYPFYLSWSRVTSLNSVEKYGLCFC